MGIKCKQKISNIHIIGIPAFSPGMEIKYVEINFLNFSCKRWLEFADYKSKPCPRKTNAKLTTPRKKISGLQR